MSTRTLLAVVVLTAGCASPPAAPTAADAEAFVAAAERELDERSEYENRVAWVYETYITHDTEWLQQRSRAEGVAARVRLAHEAARFRTLRLPPGTRRKLDLLRLRLVLPAPNAPGAADELSAIATRLGSIYATGRIDDRGRRVPLDELETLMGSERDPARLQQMWTRWHAVAEPMAHDYAQLVEIANQGARELGFADLTELWLSSYDMPAADMEREVERLWAQLAPFYQQLHCHVRAELNRIHGDAIVPLDQPIRADILGNMWAQDWSALLPIVGPGAQPPAYDLTEQLVNAGYTPVSLTETAERFYSSLGLAELPETFWERSLLTRPQDREVVCHASAWDIDDESDLRVKQCIQINAQHFRTIHHELGHNYYQRAYSEQPILFRAGAHDGFHEAIGDFVALNNTPAYLVRIGLIEKSQVPPASSDIGLLMQQALAKVAFLPFALTVDEWRWRVFRGQIAPTGYNDAWWELRTRYQGIRPPAPRPATAFDPGAKYHIPASVPYLRYFLATVLQFQFYEAACRQAGWDGPLHRCTLYGNREVGARLAAMMEMGASRPWPEALAAFTGTRRMDGSAMAAYFAPLQTWLEERNRGRQCGWR